MTRQAWLVSVCAIAGLMFMPRFAFQNSARAEGPKRVLPIFQVDSNFPTMPAHVNLGGVGGVNADSHGNVWVFQQVLL